MLDQLASARARGRRGARVLRVRPLGGDEARAKLEGSFGKKLEYGDIPGLCRAASLDEIEAQDWSLNPGRYVGVAASEVVSDDGFKEQLDTLNAELVTLTAKAHDLEQTIARDLAKILDA